MRDNKAFASLSSGLLARKGQARPAMRPQGFGFGTGSAEDLGWNDMGHDVPPPPRAVTPKLPSSLAGPPVAMPVEPPVVRRQQEEIAREFAVPAAPVVAEPVVETPHVERTDEALVAAPAPAAPEARAVPKAAKPAGKKTDAGEKTNKAPKGVARRSEGRKAAFTLRLDAERHLRLRLACALQNRSAQLLVVEALDQLLGSLPDVARLADSLPAHD